MKAEDTGTTALARNSAIQRTLGLGAVAGVRSMTAPALLSWAASRGGIGGFQGTPFAALASPIAARLLTLLAVGEAAADKFPAAPNRVSIPGLLGRVVSGAVVGAALFASEGRRGLPGATLGALCAVAAAYPSYYLRVGARERLGVPNAALGLVEDTVAVGTGLAALRR